MPQDDLVTLAEASRRLGLQNLRDYKQKYPGFPNPHRREYPFLWRYAEVQAWYTASVKRRRPA